MSSSPQLIVEDNDPRIEKITNQDLEGKYLVYSAKNLRARFRHIKNQVMLCSGGFGANGAGSGGKVYVTDLLGGECHYRRGQFLGIASPELVKQVKESDAQDLPIDLTETLYMAVTAGEWAKGDTIAGAIKKLGTRKKLGSKGLSVYKCHPEATINDWGMIQYPKGTTCEEVK